VRFRADSRRILSEKRDPSGNRIDTHVLASMAAYKKLTDQYKSGLGRLDFASGGPDNLAQDVGDFIAFSPSRHAFRSYKHLSREADCQCLRIRGFERLRVLHPLSQETFQQTHATTLDFLQLDSAAPGAEAHGMTYGRVL
jgi:hypothetical protein